MSIWRITVFDEYLHKNALLVLKKWIGGISTFIISKLKDREFSFFFCEKAAKPLHFSASLARFHPTSRYFCLLSVTVSGAGQEREKRRQRT